MNHHRPLAVLLAVSLAALLLSVLASCAIAFGDQSSARVNLDDTHISADSAASAAKGLMLP